MLVQWNLRMLHGQRQTLLRKVEHVEDNGLGASVLAMMDSVYHFHDNFALSHHFLLAVKADNGQFALYQYAVVHHGVVMPAQFLSGGNLVFHSHQLGTALQVFGQLYAVPALRGANQLGGPHLLREIIVLSL